MRSSVKKSALLALIAACAATAGATRRQDSETFEGRRKAVEAKVLSIPGAPVRFEISPSGTGYQVCNHHETAAMISFRFGCVEEKKGGLKVLGWRPPKEMFGAVIEPKAGDRITCYGSVVNHGLFPEAFCKAGKLAVVEVEFDDGTVWELESPGR